MLTAKSMPLLPFQRVKGFGPLLNIKSDSSNTKSKRKMEAPISY